MKNNVPKEQRKAAGIYQILNTVNGKCYIGSTVNLQARYSQHKCALLNETHPCGHLVRSFNVYGATCFEFNLVETCLPNTGETEQQLAQRLCDIEQGHILRLRSNERAFGYNKRAVAQSNLGIKFSEESKAKMRGKTRSALSLQKQSMAMQGEKHPAAIITDEVARLIKIMLYRGYRPANVAAHFSIKKSIVNDIKNFGRWAHIVPTQDELDSIELPNCRQGTRLNDHEVRLIRYLLSMGERVYHIAAHFKTASSTVQGIKDGKIYSALILSTAEILGLQTTIPADYLESTKRAIKQRESTTRSAYTSGDGNGAAKLTKERVLEICGLLAQNLSSNEIGGRYGISADSVCKIERGQNWGHITGIKKKSGRVMAGATHPRAKYNPDSILRIVELTSQGQTTKQIGELLGFRKEFIDKVKRGRLWSSVTGIQRQ